VRPSIIRVVCVSIVLGAIGSLSVAQDKSGPTKPLPRAAMQNDIEQIKRHIAQGTDVNARDAAGVPPLCYAVEAKSTEAVRLLVDAGADVNAKGSAGRTPLILATQQDSIEIVDLLLSKGADVNGKDDMQGTALHAAAEWGYRDIAEALIKAGANVNAVNGQQQTPLSLAQNRQQVDVAELLKQHGATLPAPVGLYDPEYGHGMPQAAQTPAAEPVLETAIDANAIRQELRAFEGLEAALQTLDANSVGEQKAWVQQRTDNRTNLLRAADKQFGEEMAFVRRVATDEKATKTVQGIDDLSAKRKERSDLIGEALREDRRATMQQEGRMAGRTGRVRGMTGGAAQGGGGLYGNAGPETNVRSRRAEPNQAPVDPDTETLVQAWTAAKPENKHNLLDAVQKVDLADLAGLRTIATEEQAKKTTAAIGGLMLMRQQRVEKITKDSEEEAARLQRLQDRMGGMEGMTRGRGVRGATQGATGQQGDQPATGRNRRYR
jgi:hypothetical protein